MPRPERQQVPDQVQPINRSAPVRLALLAATLVALGAWAPPAQAINFSVPSNFPAGSEPQAVVVGKFNSDSYPDLAVANEAQHGTGSGSVMVFLGSASGSFGSPVNIPFSGHRPTEIAVDDFNGDSRDDLAVANFASDSVSVLLGNGNGTFNGPTNVAAVPHGSPVSIKADDLNHDSKPDLVVVNEGSDYNCQPGPCATEPGSVSVFLGVGNGTFTVLPKFGAFMPVRSVQSVAVGRFNGDSHPDLALANKIPGKVAVLTGAGDGTLSGPTEYPVGTEPSAVAVGQFSGDADSYPDIVATNELSHDVSVLHGSAGGIFADAITFAAPLPVNTPVAVSVDQLNADSFSDIVVSNIDSDNVSVLLGGAGGTFAGSNFAAGDGPTSAAVGDFNGDTYNDIAVTNELSNNVSILFATRPETNINSGPPALGNDPSPTFAFSSNDPSSTFHCKVDGGSFSPCSSPYPTTLNDGAHTFQVRATDNAGRTDATPASWSFTIDTVPPNTPSMSDTEPHSPANDNNPRVRGTAPAGTTVALYTTLDCTGPLAASGSAADFNSIGIPVSVRDDTSTEFYATATDAAGNVSGCPVEPVIYVEVSPPPPPDPGPPPGGGVPPGPGGPGGAAPGSPIVVDVIGPLMAVTGKTAKLQRSGTVSLSVSCPASEPGGCSGSLSVETAAQVRAVKRKVKLGKSTFRIAGGKSGSVKLRLSKRNRELVKKLRKVRVLVVINARDQVGNARTTKTILALKS